MPLEESYREIQLTRGQVTRVSACKFEGLALHEWYALKRARGGYYAVRKKWINGKQVTIYMHREILGILSGDADTGDHINHDTLDNRDENLRVASHIEQQYNKRRLARNKSGLKGVSWDSTNKKWTAHISANKTQKNLGRFATKEEAHAAYCEAAARLHGEFANLY